MTGLPPWFPPPDEYAQWPQVFKDALSVSSMHSDPEDDPDDTVLWALTRQDVSIVSLALNVIARLYPDLEVYAIRAMGKLHELASAQGFFEEGGEHGGRD